MLEQWATCIALTAVFAFGTQKSPAPSAEVQAPIRERIHEQWRSEFRANRPGRQLALADELAAASAKEVDAATRYVLGLEELSLCTRAGDINRAVTVGRTVDAAFEESGAVDVFASVLAKELRVPRHRETCHSIATLELANPTSHEEHVALGELWDKAREKAPASVRSLPAVCARDHVLQAAWLLPKETKLHARATFVLRRCEADIEKADAKARRFTLFEGRWLVIGESGAVSQYEIDNSGAVSCSEQVLSDGTRVAHSPEIASLGVLRRRSGAVVGKQVQDDLMHRLWIEGDQLLVEPYPTRGRVPKTWTGKARGARDHLPAGAGIALAHARSTLRLGKAEDTLEALAAAGRTAPDNEHVTQERYTIAVSAKVLGYAVQSLGEKVGNGECWTLADEALKHANAERPSESPGFGRRIGAEEDVLPGDVVQFEGARFEFEGGAFISMPHHTAVVRHAHGGRRVDLLHQNFGKPGKKVSLLHVDLVDISAGTFEIYRPLSRKR